MKTSLSFEDRPIIDINNGDVVTLYHLHLSQIKGGYTFEVCNKRRADDGVAWLISDRRGNSFCIHKDEYLRVAFSKPNKKATTKKRAYSLDDFIKDLRPTSDDEELHRLAGDMIPKGVTGLVWGDGHYIEDAHSWKNARGENAEDIKPREGITVPRWYVLVCRTEQHSDNLREVAELLYQWIAGERYEEDKYEFTDYKTGYPIY